MATRSKEASHHPFPTDLFAMLYILVNNPRPIVSEKYQWQISLKIMIYNCSLNTGRMQPQIYLVHPKEAKPKHPSTCNCEGLETSRSSQTSEGTFIHESMYLHNGFAWFFLRTIMTWKYCTPFVHILGCSSTQKMDYHSMPTCH